MTAATATSVTVAWSPSSDNVGVRGYGVYRGGNRVETTDTSHSLTGLSCGTAYQVGVDAYDVAGNRSPQATLMVTTAACPDSQVPSVPTNVTAPTRTATSIALSWSASSDNVGVVGYGLYKGGTRVATTSGTTGIFNSLACGTNYTLAVDAYDAAGNRSSQAVVMVSTTTCPDTQAPSQPSGLTAGSVSPTGLTVIWAASTDNVAVTGYDVYRNGAKVGTTTSRTYAQSGLTCGTAYTFGVVAFDAAGNRSGQAQLATTTAVCPPPPGSAQVYVSPSGNDGTCARLDTSKPCGSFDRAYAIASLGDVIEVAGGSYPSQTISEKPGKDGSGDLPDIVLRPATGAIVRVAGLTLGTYEGTIGPDHLTIRDISDSRSPQGAFSAHGDTTDVTWENLDAANFYLGKDVARFTVRGGDWGPCTVPSGICSNSKIDVEVTGPVLVENARFHDYRIVPGSGEHFECMIVFGGQGITIRNNTFRNCEYYNIFLQHAVWAGSRYTPPEPFGIVIEGNDMEASYDGNGTKDRMAIGFSERGIAWEDVVVRCNNLNGSYISMHDDGQTWITYENFSVQSTC
jgi:chitodextrinase